MKPRWKDLCRLALAGALIVAARADAHDFWINPDRFTVSVGDTSVPGMQVGHGEDRQRSAIPSRRIVRFAAYTPSGDVIDLRGDGKFPVREAGMHVLLLETDANAQSHLPAARFNAYLKDEGLDSVLAWRAQRGVSGRDAIERYRRVAKALVQAGESEEGNQQWATARLGLPLEIVLLANPAELRAADALGVRVFFEGRPLGNALVKLTDLNNDAMPKESRRTDADGYAHFANPGRGSWLLNVISSKPIDGENGADFDTIFSSLSFGLP